MDDFVKQININSCNFKDNNVSFNIDISFPIANLTNKLSLKEITEELRKAIVDKAKKVSKKNLLKKDSVLEFSPREEVYDIPSELVGYKIEGFTQGNKYTIYSEEYAADFGDGMVYTTIDNFGRTIKILDRFFIGPQGKLLGEVKTRSNTRS